MIWGKHLVSVVRDTPFDLGPIAVAARREPLLGMLCAHPQEYLVEAMLLKLA